MWRGCGMGVTYVEGVEVSLREVHHVDVVAHARAVGRLVVAAVDAQELAAAHRDLRDARRFSVTRSDSG